MKRLMLALFACLLAACAWLGLKSYTDPIFAPNSVARLHTIEVNGDRQWLLERGHDRSKPVILFLHGGPGMPAMFTAHAFQRELERDFVVVHWDQRGAGKSFHADLDPGTMTFTQLMDDAVVVVNHLRRTYGVERVILVGHSHGTFLGAHLAAARPDLFAAYVGLGQVADPAAEHAAQDAMIAAAFAERDETAPAITPDNREALLFDIGGELAGARSMWPLVGIGLMAPEYSLGDVMNVAKGPQFAQQHLRYDIDGGYGPPPTTFSIPVYIIMGARDAVTPVALAQTWFERVDAPEKHWLLIEDAAHFPHVEQPAAFAGALVRLRS